jgi:O-antigen biosynthesis protein
MPTIHAALGRRRTFAGPLFRGTRLRSPLLRTVPSPLCSSASSGRVQAAGKFFELDGHKWYLKGLTYGPFAPNQARLHLPEREQMRADFAQMRALGANCVRVYHRPPRWVLDLALEHDLRVFVDVPWEKHRCFFEDWSAQRKARAEARRTARKLGGHPGLFAISVANEFPSDVVRFYGGARVARFVDELVDTVKQQSAGCLTTFANYPSTEYLRPSAGDFLCFNVYLESEEALSAYVDRLQHLAGARPLILGEFGIDSFRHGEDGQAAALEAHIGTVFHHGLAGSFVFSFTDDWFTGGSQIEDWAFGLTRRNRSEKPAAVALQRTWSAVPVVKPSATPKVSVVVCSYNGAKTLRECLTSLMRLNYADYEVILVDDGSTDETRAIAGEFPDVLYIHQTNRGLSVARNVGARAASGEIVAYTDSDCVADPDWLFYLVDAMQRQEVKAIGGPNLPPPSDSWTAKCVAASPGGPSHVMLDDRRAEHVPGCNMAFNRRTLLELGGFDPQFRQAGDDVDICWRLLDAGVEIGYAASALVWHHRRNTVRAFLKQQRGYGHSEAMLLRKHHRRFNHLGCSQWRGIIYGEGAIGLATTGPLVFHGRYGSGLFQTIYHRQDVSLWAYFTLLEWHALALVLLALSPLVPAAAALTGMMWALTLCAAARSTAQSPLPDLAPLRCRLLVFALHLVQPVVRSLARYRERVARRQLPAADDPKPLLLKRTGFATRDAYWTSDRGLGREQFLEALEAHAKQLGWGGNFHEEWEPWDVLLHGDCWCSLSVRTATEDLGRRRRFTRVRTRVQSTLFARVIGWTLAGITAVAAVRDERAVLLGCAAAASAFGVQWLLSSRRCFAAVSVLLARAGETAGLDVVPISTKVKGNEPVNDSGAVVGRADDMEMGPFALEAVGSQD